MSNLDLKHSINISHTPSLAHGQNCEVSIIVSESHNVKAEVAPGDFQVLLEGNPEEYSFPSILFSFDSLRSTRCYDLFTQRLLVLKPRMHPTTRQYLVENLIERMMNLVSLCGENDINLGFVVDARLDVEYLRIADEEELAPYRLLDEMDDVDDNMNDDDETNLKFKGVEQGRYNRVDDKEEVITCSVCLEDLTSGMEFDRLPCSHIFHTSCIDPWLERNRSCPNCRNKLEDENGVVVAITTLLRILNDRRGQV